MHYASTVGFNSVPTVQKACSLVPISIVPGSTQGSLGIEDLHANVVRSIQMQKRIIT